MSQRPPVDAQRIELFLVALGREADVAGQVFLVGGTTLVYAGLRSQTIDIDLTYDLAAADHTKFITAVRRLKDRLQINVEEASPADFIPLPRGSRDRARYVGRYGRLEVYHFDPYSVALSKIERGREEDFHDVIALLDSGWLDWERLTELFNEVLPRMVTESLKGDPESFQRQFEVLRDLLQSRG